MEISRITVALVAVALVSIFVSSSASRGM